MQAGSHGNDQSISKFKQKESCYADAGKVQTLLKLLNGYMKEGRKVLIFSQVCRYSRLPSRPGLSMI